MGTGTGRPLERPTSPQAARLRLGFVPDRFDPAGRGGVVDTVSRTVTFVEGESRYVYDKQIILAVNLALAADRPLLVAGPPGGGKSTLAANVAAILGRRFYKRVVTSRMAAADLLWSFDALRRLNDAQAARGDKELPPRAAYVEPQILWWAFDPDSAKLRGANDVPEAKPPDGVREAPDAVVLLDEIDKAEPDVPNDLLVPLDERRFDMLDLERPVTVQAKRSVLTIITTNGERELPHAFMRRCVFLELAPIRREWLTRIADDRFGEDGHELHAELAEKMMPMIGAAARRRLRAASTAEYLDTIQACKTLGIKDFAAPSSDVWQQVRQAMLWKQDEKDLPPDQPDAS